MEKIRNIITEIKTSKKKLMIVVSVTIIILISLVAVLLGIRAKNTKVKNQVKHTTLLTQLTVENKNDLLESVFETKAGTKYEISVK